MKKAQKELLDALKGNDHSHLSGVVSLAVSPSFVETLLFRKNEPAIWTCLISSKLSLDKATKNLEI